MARTEIKNFILSKLYDHDDLDRMEMFCKGRSPEQMQEPFGHPGNGVTRQQYLDRLRERRAQHDEARAFIQNL